MNRLLLISVLAFSGSVLAQFDRRQPTRDNTITECFSKVADVFFILDSSSSIWVEDYRKTLDFVSQVVTRFDISREDTRIGALSFSDDYTVGFDLDRYRSKSEVLASVDERTLPYKTGVTNTDAAIRYVRENVIFREDITKVMVVITDGGSRSPGATEREADLARDKGFHMVVVGVGQFQDEYEWRRIASDPDNDYIFNITSFNFLESLQDSLPRRICLYPPIILGGECNVLENADLFFLAAPDGINDALDVMGSLQEDFQFRNNLRVRYIMPACQDVIDSNFNPDIYCDRFGDAIEQTDDTYLNLVEELRVSAQEMSVTGFSPNQVAVLFIDDRTIRVPDDERYQLLQALRNSVNVGLKIIIVDLGVTEFQNYLPAMAGNNREDVINYSVRSSRTVSDLLDRICIGLNEVPTFGTVAPSK